MEDNICLLYTSFKPGDALQGYVLHIKVKAVENVENKNSLYDNSGKNGITGTSQNLVS